MYSTIASLSQWQMFAFAWGTCCRPSCATFQPFLSSTFLEHFFVFSFCFVPLLLSVMIICFFAYNIGVHIFKNQVGCEDQILQANLFTMHILLRLNIMQLFAPNVLYPFLFSKIMQKLFMQDVSNILRLEMNMLLI